MRHRSRDISAIAGEPFDLNAHRPCGWSAKRIKIGRFIFEDVHVQSREGSHDLNDTLRMANDKTRRVRGAQSRYVEPLPASAPARLLSIEAADYLDALTRRGLASGSLTSKEHMFRLLRLASGDLPVSDIGSAHMREFWDVHRWWPRKASSKKCYRGMTDAEILAEGKRMNSPAPRASSIKAAKADLAAFFNHLLRTRIIHHTPIDPFLDIKDDLMGPDARRPFTDQELATLFDPANLLPWAKKSPHAWWGPILGLYTGARVNEISQLKVGDVVDHFGRVCLAIRKTVDADLAGNTQMRTRQRLKGKSAIRFIPIAQPVLDAGFLDYVADVRATKHPRLFPHLSCGVNKKTGEPNGAGYGRGLSTRFSEYLHGVLDLPSGFSFHLFRHTLATALELQNVKPELIATITGHEIRKIVPVLQEVYLHGQPDRLVEQQVQAIALFAPPVVLPTYVRGQFARQFGPDAKFYP